MCSAKLLYPALDHYLHSNWW